MITYSENRTTPRTPASTSASCHDNDDTKGESTQMLSELWARALHPSTTEQDCIVHSFTSEAGQRLHFAAVQGFTIAALWIPQYQDRPFLVVGGLVPGYILTNDELTFVACCWTASQHLRTEEV